MILWIVVFAAYFLITLRKRHPIFLEKKATTTEMYNILGFWRSKSNTNYTVSWWYFNQRMHIQSTIPNLLSYTCTRAYTHNKLIGSCVSNSTRTHFFKLLLCWSIWLLLLLLPVWFHSFFLSFQLNFTWTRQVCKRTHYRISKHNILLAWNQDIVAFDFIPYYKRASERKRDISLVNSINFA